MQRPVGIVDPDLALVQILPSPQLSDILSGALLYRKTGAVLASSNGKVHVVIADTPTRTFAFSPAGKPFLQYPIVAVRADAEDLYCLMPPSNRLLIISSELSDLVRHIYHYETSINAFDLGMTSVIIGYSDGRIIAWDKISNGCSWQCHISNEPVSAIAISTSQKTFFACFESGHVYMGDVKSGVASNYFFQHDSPICYAVPHPRRDGCVCSDNLGFVFVITLENQELQRSHSWKHQDTVANLAISTSGNALGVAFSDGRVIIQSLSDPSEILAQHRLLSAIVVIAFIESNPKEIGVLIASCDGAVEIWPLDIPIVNFEPGKSSTPEMSSEMAPRSGPVPIPQPRPTFTDITQAESVPLSRTVPVLSTSSLPEVGVKDLTQNRVRHKDIVPSINSATGATAENAKTRLSMPVGKFSSEAKISNMLSGSSSVSSSQLATPALNSTTWIQHQIEELTLSALTDSPNIDISAARARAANKVLRIDNSKTDVFGELPVLDFELPVQSRIHLPKQVDPKWVRSLSRKPNMESALNNDTMEPQILNPDIDWPVKEGAFQTLRHSVDIDVVSTMNATLRRKIDFWEGSRLI